MFAFTIFQREFLKPYFRKISAGAFCYRTAALSCSVPPKVGDGEVGALQGTTDTAKTVCSVLFGPAMAWIFGYFISDDAYPRKVGGRGLAERTIRTALFTTQQ